MRRRLLVLPVALVLLTGCASSPEAEVREGVRDVLAAANDQDADAVRTAVDDLLSTLRTQVGSGDLTDAEAAPVRDAALAIRDSAAELEVEPAPSPTPTPDRRGAPEDKPDYVEGLSRVLSRALPCPSRRPGARTKLCRHRSTAVPERVWSDVSHHGGTLRGRVDGPPRAVPYRPHPSSGRHR